MLHSIAPTSWPPTFHFLTPNPAEPVVSRLLKARLLPLCSPVKTKGQGNTRPVDYKASLVELVSLANLAIRIRASAELELLFVDL
jgi:hypothetical protein